MRVENCPICGGDFPKTQNLNLKVENKTNDKRRD